MRSCPRIRALKPSRLTVLDGGGKDGKHPGVVMAEGNECYENEMAGIGCRDKAKPLIVGNECQENEPVGIGVQKKAMAIIHGNKCVDNKLVAIGIIEESTATISDNAFDGYRAAVNATKATVVVTGNSIKQFQGAAIIVKDSRNPAHIHGNTATSACPKAKVVDVQGPTGVVADNTVSVEKK